MEGWKVLLGIFIGALLFFAVAAFIMPSQYLAAHVYVIRGEPEAVFDRLADLEDWPLWTIWNVDEDPTMKVQFKGPTSRVGAVLEWEGEKYGQVRRELVSLERPRELNLELRLRPGLPPAKERITLEPVPLAEGGGTRVTWGLLGDVGNDPLARLRVGIMQRNAADDFHQSLWRLAYWVELESGAIRNLPDGGIERLPWPADAGVRDAGVRDAGVPAGSAPPQQPATVER